jgi:hypothetical protein
MKAHYFYNVTVDNPDKYAKYAHLTLEIRSSTNSGQPLATLAWQCNRMDDTSTAQEGTWLKGWSDWYGCDIRVEGRSLSDIQESAAAVRSALGSQEPWQMPDVATILLRLARKKATFTEVLYDARLHQYVPIDELQPEGYEAWLDDAKAMGRSYPTTSVLARHQDEAQRKMVIALAEGGYDAVLEEFVKAGKPVYRSYEKAPADPRHAIARLGITKSPQMDMDQAMHMLDTIAESIEE